MTVLRTTTVLLCALLLPCALPSQQAQQALQAAPSGRGTSAVTLSRAGAGQGNAPALTITLDYGQPHLRGRALHTDSLVPYDEPWRLGANAATTLTTDVDLTIGTAQVGKGRWVLETIPGRTGWVLVIKRATGTGPQGQTLSEEVARTPLRHRTLGTPIESLTMWLIPSREAGAPRGELRFAWGVHELSVDWVVR